VCPPGAIFGSLTDRLISGLPELWLRYCRILSARGGARRRRRPPPPARAARAFILAMMKKFAVVMTAHFTASTASFAAAPVKHSLQPTALFGDHMVMQATDPSDPHESAHLAGLSAPGERVTLTVAFGGKVERGFETAADHAGRWDIGGIKAAMNQGPFVLTLSSMGQTLTASDVWFGTVLLCTGQVRARHPPQAAGWPVHASWIAFAAGF
jgi:hypothetical protein